MSCWTLWQRMPPRYQLTMRDIRTEDQEPPQATPGTSSRASSATPHSPRIRTSRTSRPGGSAKARRSGEPAMLTSGVLPEEESFSTLDFSVQSPVLPPRSSAYIHNMKNQMRINSARRRLNEGTLELTSPTTLSYTPKPRATTAPAFPITDPSNTDRYHRLATPAPAHPQGSMSGDEEGASAARGGGGGPSQRPQRGFSGRKTPQRPSSGYGVAGRRHVPVRTLSPFTTQMPEVTSLREENDDGSLVFQRRRSSPTHQDCVIGDYQVAALYVDNGRVTFFRKTKPDMTQSVYSAISPYNVSREDGSYLSHLRKAYLSGVRDLPKVVHKDPDLEKHNTIRERMDYDRKVGRILDYYSKVDIPTGMQTPLSPAPQRGYRISSSRRSPRVNSMAESRVAGSKITSTEFPDQHSPGGAGFGNSRGPEQGQLSISGGGGFLRINSRARLHRRHQFYLRTPASPSHPPGSDLEKSSSCVCGMCRLEMEVALMAQLHQDLGVSVDAATAARIRSSLEQGAMTTDPNQTLQSRTMTGDGRGQCPAGSTSVSDARRSGAPAQAADSVSPRVKPTTLTSQQSASSPSVPTATEKAAVMETTSLTVTLPVIEEVSDAAHAIQENEVSNPNHPATDQTADTIKQTLPAGNVEQEATNISTDGETVENSQPELPVIVSTENSVKNQELSSDTPTDKDSAQTPEQEDSDTITGRSVNKETDFTNTDENTAMNSEHGVKDNVEDLKNSVKDTSGAQNVKDSLKNSEKEASDIPSDTDSTRPGQEPTTTCDADNTASNTEHETSDTAPADDPTASKQPMSSAENTPEPGTDITEAEDKQFHSDTIENEPRHSDSASDPNPAADVREDMAGESNAAELPDAPNNSNAEQGSSTVWNHGEGMDTESSAKAQTNDNDSEHDGRAHSDDQSLGKASDSQGASEGTSPVLMKATEPPIANSTLETTPEEQNGKSKEALCNGTVETGPPKIVISLAPDNEDSVPKEETVISSASDNEDNVPGEGTKASST